MLRSSLWRNRGAGSAGELWIHPANGSGSGQ